MFKGSEDQQIQCNAPPLIITHCFSVWSHYLETKNRRILKPSDINSPNISYLKQNFHLQINYMRWTFTMSQYERFTRETVSEGRGEPHTHWESMREYPMLGRRRAKEINLKTNMRIWGFMHSVVHQKNLFAV